MTAIAPFEFSYRDKKLGDTQAVSVVTAPDVFHPTSTTVLLLRAARRALAHGPPPRTVLDLGCGSGIVGVVLAKLLPPITHVCASDLSAAAVRLARHNAARNGVAVDCRRRVGKGGRSRWSPDHLKKKTYIDAVHCTEQYRETRACRS